MLEQRQRNKVVENLLAATRDFISCSVSKRLFVDECKDATKNANICLFLKWNISEVEN